MKYHTVLSFCLHHLLFKIFMAVKNMGFFLLVYLKIIYIIKDTFQMEEKKKKNNKTNEPVLCYLKLIQDYATC